MPSTRPGGRLTCIPVSNLSSPSSLCFRLGPLTCSLSPSAASVFFMPQDIPGKNRANELVEFYTTQLKDLAPNMGAYMNEVSRCSPLPLAGSVADRSWHHRLHGTRLTGRTRTGAKTTIVCLRSRELWILMTCSGVLLVLEARGGRKSTGLSCVVCRSD